ncbi:MAG TPA: substrate-binding domain-containing protein [Terrimicrobiaceae bacterium]
MKHIRKTLAASVTNLGSRCGIGSNLRTLCFSAPLFALFLMASVTAHAEPKIGVAMSLFDDMWLTTLRHGVQSYAEKLGVKVTFEDAGGDIGKQQSQIQNFIVSKVDGILVATLVDPSAGPAISKAAQEAGIPLVFVNNAPANVDSLPDGQAFVGSNDLEAGKFQGETRLQAVGRERKSAVNVGPVGHDRPTFADAGGERCL